VETALSLCLGVGLSAACGFRVFVPLLIMSIASLTGHLTLAPGFAWIATYPALVAFSVATVTEIAAYFFPWVDHALDTIATPAAIVAGTLVTASVVTNMDPFLKWTLALVAGGGISGLVQGATVVTRGLSTATTGGIGNPVVATLELAGSVVTSILALLAPIAALALITVLLAAGSRLLRRNRD
jgi:hypothetical protein